MWSVLRAGKKPWAPRGRWLCSINFLNPMTSTITRPYCRHAINIVKWNWITCNAKRTHSLCLSGRSVWICLEVLARISPSRCLSGKEGHRLEVFAYKLIWRSSRPKLCTEGKENDAFRLAFSTKQWRSLAVMERQSSREEHKHKMSRGPPSPFSPPPPSLPVSSPSKSCWPSGLCLPLWTVKWLRSRIIATNHWEKTFSKKGLI